jgi:hypothetical protein
VAITNRDDVGADGLILRAESMDLAVYRFNTEDYPARVGITFDPVSGRNARLLTPNGDVDMDRPRGFWVRRPHWPTLRPDITDPLDRDLAFNEAIAALGGYLRVNADRCVSPPDAMQAARWKVPGLNLAASLGMRVPDSLVTTSASSARVFAGEAPTVAKAVGDLRARAASRERYGYTTMLRPDAPLGGAEAAPVLYQRAIAKAADLRVTVVGATQFAVAIRTPPGAPLDFRATDVGAATYEVVALPADLGEQIARYMRALGLRFACFDFALAADGAPWFLECNPAGQYGWIEAATSLDITGALIDELLRCVA